MQNSDNIPFSVVFAAGGMGTRMGKDIPKQYIPIHNKPLALYSFELFVSLPEVEEIVVVCEPQYQQLFISRNRDKNIVFALPGKLRQDSVYNGIQKLSGKSTLACIHDSARPCIDVDTVRKVIEAADEWGAAVVGVPVKATIKICDEHQMILSTPNRSGLWEMQTPQVIRLDLLQEAYKIVLEKDIVVTDDVSLMELINKPVKVVTGSYRNLKVTTPEDLIFVERLLESNVLL